MDKTLTSKDVYLKSLKTFTEGIKELYTLKKKNIQTKAKRIVKKPMNATKNATKSKTAL